MSKSKNNGVDPQALIDSYGADTARLFMMFASPPEQTLEWSESGVEGAFRFLKRLWKFATDNLSTGPVPLPEHDNLDDEEKAVRRKIHETIAKVNDDIGRRYTFNTAIAAVMELINTLTRMDNNSAGSKAILHEGLEVILLLMSPIVPHITQYLWSELGHDGLIMDAGWPLADPAALARDETELIVQVNGRLRGKIRVPVEATEEIIRNQALENENVSRFLSDKQIKKTVHVPGRLINIVTST